MDFLDPKKKRAYKIRLYIGYVLMAVALSIGTLILLLEAFGYDLYNRSGVIQNGLVFVENKPEAANILVNDKLEGRAGKRLVLPEGEYHVKLERGGYRSWERTFDLAGGGVERLTYPILFPETLEPQDAKTYGMLPGLATQSPDRRWLLVQHPGQLRAFDVVDLNSADAASEVITLPEALFSAGSASQLAAVEWSTNNRHVLLSHSFQTGDANNPAGLEFVVVDRQNPAESFNVNKVFNGAVFSQVALRDKKFDQLYLLDGNGTLHRGQVSSAEAAPLANRVRAFKGYAGDTILYVTDENAPPEKALALVRRGDNTYKLAEIPRSNLYVVDMARYKDRWYMAVGTDVDRRTLIYRNAFDDIARDNPRLPAPVAILRLEQLRHLSFSANAQFIGVQGGSEFSVYDAEHDRQYRYDTGLKLAPAYRAVWMDGYRYMVVSDGEVVVFDYDGINTERLTVSNPAFLPFFDRNYDVLYTLGPSVEDSERNVLLRTSMRTPADQ